MAYGVLYEFRRTSTNGADILITISQRDYEGEVKQRSLGRAPVLKRENNGHIYGTSCELYAECLVDGEFSQLYTSDAYEFRVAVYRNDSLLWMGFVSPELYSEPDVAPPYDVRIIATDGLGELKNFKFEKRGVASMLSHINYLVGITGVGMTLNVVSELRYVDDAGVASADKGVLNFKINLDHEEGSTCYDVLQNLMSSINANITQYNGGYLIFRETDFINKATEEGVEGFDINGSAVSLPVASFGSMNQHKWWPVGQLSTVIEPAKNEVVLRAADHYKDNVLDFDDWALANAASFNEEEGAYILPDEGSNISYELDFDGNEVYYRLGLRVRARNVGSGQYGGTSDEDQNIGLIVEIDGGASAENLGNQFWLIKSEGISSGHPLSEYMWKNTEDYFEEELRVPSAADSSADAQNIDIILPLYDTGRNNYGSYAYARNIKITIFNPAGIHDIYVYDVSLVKYEQIEGYEADVVINNAAREEEGEVELTMSAGDLAPAAGKVFMTGLPLLPLGSDPIKQWQVGNGNPQDYLSVMAYDYSRAIALPKMKYAGVLNVPGETVSVPLLFLRDGTYYFPKTYSYDIYNDELEVELISISAADVSLTSVIISQMAQSSGNMGGLTTSGSGGGGVVSLPRDKEMSDTSDNAVENRVIKAYVDGEVKEVADLLASMWYFDSDGNLCTDHDVIIKANLIVEKDTSSGGEGEDTPSGGGGIDEEQLAEYLESNNYVNSVAKITSLLGYTPANGANYLPLAGGTIESTSTSSPLIIKTASNGWLMFRNTAGYLGEFGFSFEKIAHCTDTDGNARKLIHSGNIGSQSVSHATTTNRFKYIASSGDLNTVLAGGGLARTYSNYMSNIFTNAPSGMRYGMAIQFSAASAGTEALSGQLAWDVNHASTADTTRYLWWRAADTNVFTNSKWHQIAFTDSNVASAQALVHSNGTVGATVNSSGNVTIGSSDLAGTSTKLYVNGYQYIYFANSSDSISGATGLHINRYGFDSMSDAGAALILTTGSKGSVIYGGNLGFAVNYYNGSAHSRLITALPNGNVLIGTSTDSGYKLDVAGTGRFTGAVTMSSTLTVGGDITPSANNSYTLGTSSFRWAHVNAYKYHVGGNYYTYITESGGYLDLVSFGNEMCIGTSSNSGDIHINYRKSSSGYVPSTYYWRAGSSSSYANFYLGNLVAAGDTSSGSDIRFKDIIKNKTLKIADIAKAPLFTFKWNDREDDAIHLGSSAQYWEKVCPWLVSGSDFKSLNYATLGVAMGISLAKKAVNHEARIKELEKEIKRLKEEMRYGDR